MINISIMISKLLQYNLSEKKSRFYRDSGLNNYSCSDLEWNCEISWEVQVLACVLFQHSVIYEDEFSVNMLQQWTDDITN